MKSRINKALFVFLIVIISCLCVSVRADYTSYNGGEVYNGQYIGTSGGKYLENCVGFRIALVSSSNTLKDSKIILNENSSCNNKLFSGYNVPKTFYPDSIIGWNRESIFKSGEIIRSSYVPASWSGLVLENILTENRFSLLKTYINLFGWSPDSEDYIFVEPMTVIDNYYGTAFEFMNSFGNVSSYSQSRLDDLVCTKCENEFLYRYISLFQGSGGNNGGIFFTTIFTTKNVLGISEYNGWQEQYASDYSSEYYKKVGPRIRCLMERSCGRGMGVYKYSEVNPPSITPPLSSYKITLYKIDADNPSLMLSQAKFRLYDSNYNELSHPPATGADGKLEFSNLSDGTYYLEETLVPPSYQNNGAKCNGCTGTVTKNNVKYFKVIINGKNKTIYISNKKSCESAFTYALQSGNPSNTVTWQERIDLYNIFKKTNLLNTNKSTAEEACTDNTTCAFGNNTSCLMSNVYNPQFNSNNLSCFTQQIIYNQNKVMYCSPKFTFRTNISTNFVTKAGQPILKYNNPQKIGTGKLELICYDPLKADMTPITITNSNFIHYSMFISNELDAVKFAGVNLHYSADGKDWEQSVTKVTTSGSSSASGPYVFSATTDYYLTNKMYSEKLNGEISNTPCTGCRFLGYGIISKFSANSGILDFSIKLSSYNKFRIGNVNNRYLSPSAGNECKVIIEQEIIPPTEDRLNIEFRIIDKNNPFPGESGGNSRRVGTNWCDQLNNYNGDSVINENDILFLTVNETTSYTICSQKSGNNRVNQTIARNITYANDSYDSTQAGPKYTIMLTSSDIKTIKDYNRTTTYDDYNFTCKGNNCSSNFLSDLKDDGIVVINNIN